MKKAFVVNLELFPGEDILAVAQDIHDALADDYKVISVNPWAEQTIEPIAPPPIP